MRVVFSGNNWIFLSQIQFLCVRVFYNIRGSVTNMGAKAKNEMLPPADRKG